MTKYSKKFFAECGREGGIKVSEAKKIAVRENGKKGGRPKKINCAKRQDEV